MDDPLKKYVQENRDSFDQLEPSEAVLHRLKGQLKPIPVIKKGIFANHRQRAWLVAASLLLGLVITYALYQAGETPSPESHQMAQQATPPVSTDTTPSAEPAVEEMGVTPSVERETQLKKPAAPALPEPEVSASLPAALYAQLADSSSASTRLAAILEIERTGYMDEAVVGLLSSAMNQDDNSNVRIAALDLLGRHAHDPHVTELFIASLATQDDPFVQLGLIHFLKQVDDQEVDESLFALANNPSTFVAVKDEAYMALLNQNKL